MKNLTGRFSKIIRVPKAKEGSISEIASSFVAEKAGQLAGDGRDFFMRTFRRRSDSLSDEVLLGNVLKYKVFIKVALYDCGKAQIGEHVLLLGEPDKHYSVKNYGVLGTYIDMLGEEIPAMLQVKKVENVWLEQSFFFNMHQVAYQRIEVPDFDNLVEINGELSPAYIPNIEDTLRKICCGVIDSKYLSLDTT